MIPHAKKLFIPALLLFAVLAPSFGEGTGGGHVSEKVVRVIDGDTLEISGGERIRLLGIDAPERGDVLFDPATDRLKELTASGLVILEMCEDRDIYGRLLATVMTDSGNVNRILLREGMALPMLIPPCGRPVAVDVLVAAAQGALSGKGIYSLNGYGMLSPMEAGDHIGEYVIVKGIILDLHKGEKAWHLNFGPEWKTDFTAVLFREGRQRFIDLGLDPVDLVGSEVLVIGKVKRYSGPEIIVRGPDQVIPLSGITIQDSIFKIQKEGMEN